MTPAEQTAFVEAYANNVAEVSEKDVAAFVARHVAGEQIEYSGDYTSIMDALMMWHSACKWQTAQHRDALTLSHAELIRHAGDTDSGETAIAAVERALT